MQFISVSSSHEVQHRSHRRSGHPVIRVRSSLTASRTCSSVIVTSKFSSRYSLKRRISAFQRSSTSAFWDCVDVISSSGYYPVDKWEQELNRIEKTVLKYQKPFFFAEAGCMSRKGSGMVPNNWELQGELYLEEQCEWYQAMFEACKNRSWLRGFALWEWAPKLPSESEAWKDNSYEICNKPVQEVIKRFYENETEK